MPKSNKTKAKAHYHIRLYRHDGGKRSFYFHGAGGMASLALAKARRFVLEKAYDFNWIQLFDTVQDQLIEEYDENKIKIIR